MQRSGIKIQTGLKALGDAQEFHAFVSGDVQGVRFRLYTAQQASYLGVNGWVRNLSDGRVEVLAQGDTTTLNSMLEYLNQGAPMSTVTGVNVTWQTPTQTYTGFEILA